LVGTSGPYLIKIIIPAPLFVGKANNTVIGESEVKVGEIKDYELPAV